MKKVFIILTMFALAAIFAVAIPLTKAQQTYVSAAKPAEISMPISQNLEMEAVTVPVTTSNGTTTMVPIYTKEGAQICKLVGSGLFATSTGKPIMNPTDSTVTGYNDETEEFLDGANRRITAYYNGFLDKYYLRVGAVALEGIYGARTVCLVRMKMNDGTTKEIYAFREKIDHGISILWKPGKWFNTEYRYFDMSNTQIPTKYLAEWDDATFAKSMLGNAIWFTVTGIPGLIAQWLFGSVDNYGASYVKVYEKTTLADLWLEVRNAEPPMPKVQEVVTQDGQSIYYRATTKQCVNFFNYPLFHIETGCPLVFHEDKIFVVTKQGLLEPEIRDGVLRNVVSVQQLMDSDTSFYIDIALTAFGEIDVVVFNLSNDAKKPQWVLPNGESTEGFTKGLNFSAVLDGDGMTLGDLLKSIFSGGGTSFLSKLWSTVKIIIFFAVVGIVVLILAIPLVKLFKKLRANTKKKPYRKQNYYRYRNKRRY